MRFFETWDITLYITSYTVSPIIYEKKKSSQVEIFLLFFIPLCLTKGPKKKVTDAANKNFGGGVKGSVLASELGVKQFGTHSRKLVGMTTVLLYRLPFSLNHHPLRFHYYKLIFYLITLSPALCFKLNKPIKKLERERSRQKKVIKDPLVLLQLFFSLFFFLFSFSSWTKLWW